MEIKHTVRNALARTGISNAFKKAGSALEKADAEGFLRKHWALLALIPIIFIGMYIRLLPMEKDVCIEGMACLPALDPLWIYRMGNDLLANNFHLLEVDNLRYHPWGVQNSAGYFPGVLYTPPMMYVLMLLFKLNVSFLTWARLLPPVFGALFAVPMYYMGKELYDKMTGLFAAFFLATAPATLYRTAAGYLEKEPISGLFILCMFYFFVRTMKKDSWLSALLMGLFFTAGILAWTGPWVMLYIIFATCFLSLLANKPAGPVIKVCASMIILPMTLYHLAISGLNYNIIVGMQNFYGMTLIGMLVLALARQELEKRALVSREDSRYIIPVLSVMTVVLVLIGSFFSPTLAAYVSGISEIFNITTIHGIVESTVAENNPGTWNDIRANLRADYAVYATHGTLPALKPLVERLIAFPIPIFHLWTFMALGVILLSIRILQTHKWEKYFALLWLAATLYGSGPSGRIRAIFLLGPPAALIGGYFMSRAVQFVAGLKQVKEAEGLDKLNIYSVPALILMLVMLWVNILAGVGYSSSMGPGVPQNWQDAMEFVKTQTPDGSVLMSWWDYGYWFQTLGERDSIADGGNINGTADVLLGNFFTSSNIDDYYEYLDQVDPDYIIVDYTLIGKYSAMSKIATRGDDVRAFLSLSPREQIAKSDSTVIVLSQGESLFYIPVGYDGSLKGNIVLSSAGAEAYVKYICTENGIVDLKPPAPAWETSCLTYTKYGWMIPVPHKEDGISIFANLYFWDGRKYDFLEKVFDNEEIKIFRIDKEKVHERSEKTRNERGMKIALEREAALNQSAGNSSIPLDITFG